MKTKPVKIKPVVSMLVSRPEVAERWRCHSRTVLRRMTILGVKPIKLGNKSVLYRMEDVLRVEALCQ